MLCLTRGQVPGLTYEIGLPHSPSLFSGKLPIENGYLRRANHYPAKDPLLCIVVSLGSVRPAAFMAFPGVLLLREQNGLLHGTPTDSIFQIPAYTAPSLKGNTFLLTPTGDKSKNFWCSYRKGTGRRFLSAFHILLRHERNEKAASLSESLFPLTLKTISPASRGILKSEDQLQAYLR